ncbi:hypothetical protein T484DRAFT_3029825 [Baffinella frigidus]|nr:hypothetical protein T484DRAFT_3029825 [Cryptophyta sp. CCMP2293]
MFSRSRGHDASGHCMPPLPARGQGRGLRALQPPSPRGDGTRLPFGGDARMSASGVSASPVRDGVSASPLSEPVPVSAYVGSSKNLKDLKDLRAGKGAARTNVQGHTGVSRLLPGAMGVSQEHIP